MPSEHQSRREIVQLGRMLHEHGFIAATDGNLSVRLDARRILITPTGMSKGAMRPADLMVADMSGRRLKGKREVTSEIGMHLLIYRMRPDIQAIVHAHPRTATGFAAAGIALNQPLVCEVVIGLGQIPLAPYGTPGTPELARTLEPLIPDYDAILMANHGVVTYGTDLRSAYMKMETVEHFAQITLVTRMLGQQQPLADCDLEKLVAARGRYAGVNSAAPMPLHCEIGNNALEFPSQVPADGKAAPQRATLRSRSTLRPRGSAVPLEN
jgi:L-fuculose-phosphate aldolase